MNKLEILQQFQKIYGTKINPELISVKYCQTASDAFVEMLFSSITSTPVLINLYFIAADLDEDFNQKTHIHSLKFDPAADIVDNASRFLELDTYSLIVCIDNLFTVGETQAINKAQNS